MLQDCNIQWAMEKHTIGVGGRVLMIDQTRICFSWRKRTSVRSSHFAATFSFTFTLPKDLCLLQYLKNLKSISFNRSPSIAVWARVETTLCVCCKSKQLEYTGVCCTANCLHVWNTNHPFSHCHPPPSPWLQTPSIFWTPLIIFVSWFWIITSEVGFPFLFLK